MFNILRCHLQTQLIKRSYQHVYSCTRHFSLTSLIKSEPMELKMPALSPTMTEGTIIKWHKKEGDKISPGEVIFEIQTDKAVLAFDTEEEGILAKIIKQSDANSSIQVGTVVGLIVGENEDWKNVQMPTSNSINTIATNAPKQETQEVARETKTLSVEHTSESLAHQHTNTKVMGPAARSLIHNYNIDVSKLNGTGPRGLITKNDVQEYIRKNGLKIIEEKKQVEVKQEVADVNVNQEENVRDLIEQEYIDIELSNMRKVIAKRLVQSKTTIPHSYLDISLSMDNLIKARKEYMNKHSIKVSVNDFLIKAIGLSLRLVPEMNTNSHTSNENDMIYKQLATVDVSVAVATDKGLITPIVQNADKLSVKQISEKVKELADRARQNKLQPHEFQGGSFSISNLGMFGVKQFTAVINPPQIAILAVGKSDLLVDVDDPLKTQTKCIVTLSFDERAIELHNSIRFLELLDYFVKNPQILVDEQRNDYF